MARIPRSCRPSLEGLEIKLALSVAVPAASVVRSADQSVQLKASDNQNTYATLVEFTQSYMSYSTGPRYNPAFDLNHNGQIGQDDGRLLLRSLPPLSRRRPMELTLRIAPQYQARGDVPQNSGGTTHSKEPIVLGHTVPGALIFTGSGTVDLKLRGPAVVADAKGNFSFKANLSAGINQLDFQAVDAYGQQTLRAFPIYWLGFSNYELRHPRNT